MINRRHFPLRVRKRKRKERIKTEKLKKRSQKLRRSRMQRYNGSKKPSEWTKIVMVDERIVVVWRRLRIMLNEDNVEKKTNPTFPVSY